MFKSYRRFLAFVVHYRLRAALFVGILIVFASVAAIEPYFYKLFIDALPLHAWQPLLLLSLTYIGVRFSVVMLDVIAGRAGAALLIASSRDARIAVFNKIQDLDFAFHLSRSTGSLISIFKRGDSAFFNLFINLNSQCQILVQLIVMLIVFGSIDMSIMFLMFGTFVVTLSLVFLAIRYNITQRRLFNTHEDNVSSIIVDNLINYETVKYFGKEAREDSRLRSAFESWTSSIWGYEKSFNVIDLLVGIASNLGFALILFTAVTKYLHAMLSLSEVIVILGFIGAIYPRLFEMVYKFREIAKSHTDMEGYFSVLDLQEEVVDPENPVTLPVVRGAVAFENVTFSYKEGGRNALEHFNLSIQPGESVALVGKSGVGKTTIVKLLLRFFDLAQGSITIDGINIKNFTKSELRSYMGVVPQEPVLFNNSIAFNIAYGSDTATPADIARVAKMANLDEFITMLPEQYDTQVGERGVKLSGGQKQRLAIARMLLSNPSIIIFDEATSQLDSESEKYIQDAFWKVVKNKTTLIIAHRLSTIVHADKIVVMHKGAVAEIGKHEELLKIPHGIYKRYWDLQVTSV